MNPTLTNLQFLNNMIGNKIYSNIKEFNNITVKDHQHALELFEKQKILYRMGFELVFEDVPF